MSVTFSIFAVLRPIYETIYTFLSFVYQFFRFYSNNLSVSNINSTDVTLSWDNGGCSVNCLTNKVAGASSWQQGISI